MTCSKKRQRKRCVKLSDAESMTIRVAVEEKESQELSAIYVESLVRIQGLLESRESRKQ
jgi:hypothetical protein